MISTFPPPWNFKLTWAARMDKMISKFPPPWNFKWTWTFHKDKMIYQNSHPHGTSNCLGLSIKIPTPMELQMDLDFPQG